MILPEPAPIPEGVLADEALSLGKLSRTALSMGDVSPFFRQNLIHTLAHPRQAAHEIMGALSILGSREGIRGGEAAQAHFERLMTELTTRPTYALGRLAGLNHPEFGRMVEFSASDLMTQWEKKGKMNPKRWVAEVMGPIERRFFR